MNLPRILLKAETTRNPLFQTCDILGCLAKGNRDRKTHVRTQTDISRVHRLLFNYLFQGEGTLINIGEICDLLDLFFMHVLYVQQLILVVLRSVSIMQLAWRTAAWENVSVHKFVL